MARKKTAPGREAAGLRADVREAIERSFPESLVEIWYSGEDAESWFAEVEERLGRDLRKVKGVAVFYERSPDENSYPGAYDDDFDDDDFADDDDGDFDDDIDDFDDADWEEETVAGKGRVGWAVAVSTVAPFAVITLSQMELFENGEVGQPSIESHAEAEDGAPVPSPETEFRERAGEKAYKTLTALRVKLESLLAKRGITVLPEEEWRKPVPWLSPGEETLVGIPDQPLRVLDAFFFEML